MSRSREGKKVALNAIRIRELIGGLLKGYVLRPTEVVPHPLFPVAVVALLYLAGGCHPPRRRQSAIDVPHWFSDLAQSSVCPSAFLILQNAL